MTLCRKFMKDHTTAAWATHLGLTEKFTVAEIRLDKLEAEMQRSGRENLANTYLSKEEQRRFLEFTFNKRQVEWLGGRICAKYAINQLLEPTNHIEWQNWTVSADLNGKPYLKSNKKEFAGPAPAISISHSNRLAVAMAASAPCGIDIQKIVPTTLKVQDRFSIPEERSLLAKSDDLKSADENTRLTLLWSAKEAIRKAVSVHPLLYFTEIKLIKIEEHTDHESLQLDFVCQRDNTPLNNSTGSLKIMATIHEEFAFALTVITNH